MNHTDKILKEMFSRVGVKKVDTSKPDWFLKHSWTAEEEIYFINWLTDYLMEHKEARQEIMRFPFKDKKELRKFAQWFVLNYGWKYKS
jgi:hypothetical protein